MCYLESFIAKGGHCLAVGDEYHGLAGVGLEEAALSASARMCATCSIPAAFAIKRTVTNEKYNTTGRHRDLILLYHLFQNIFRADHDAMSLENCNRAISTLQFLRLAEHNDINGAKETIELIKDKVLSFETKLSGLGIDDVWKRIIRPYMMTQI